MRRFWVLLLLTAGGSTLLTASCGGGPPQEMSLDEYAIHVEERTTGGFIITGVITRYEFNPHTEKRVPHGDDMYLIPLEIHDGETSVIFWMNPFAIGDTAMRP